MEAWTSRRPTKGFGLQGAPPPPRSTPKHLLCLANHNMNEGECSDHTPRFVPSVFTLNTHYAVWHLAEQEANWGAPFQWKDLWQEDTVRLVVERVAKRAKVRPEATFANDRALEQNLRMWTSPVGAGGGHVVRSRAKAALCPPSREATYTKRDVYPPHDDSRGRCIGSYIPADTFQLSSSEQLEIPASSTYSRGAIPTDVECRDVLLKFLKTHSLDPELRAERVWSDLSKRAKGTRRPEPTDANAAPEWSVEDMEYQVYKSMRLGPGTSRIVTTRLYEAEQNRTNCYARYTTYKDARPPEDDDSDATDAPSTSAPASPPQPLADNDAGVDYASFVARGQASGMARRLKKVPPPPPNPVPPPSAHAHKHARARPHGHTPTTVCRHAHSAIST